MIFPPSTRLRLAAATALTICGTLTALPADASLVKFQSFFGAFGLSTDGGSDGSTNNPLIVNAPVGATVTAAYLYTSRFDSSASLPSTVVLGGTSVGGYTSLGVNNAGLQAFRADVTSIVAPIVNGGAGGSYNISYAEGAQSNAIDGSALVVVFSKAGLPNRSIGIYDGFSATTGDSFAVNLGAPLNKTPDLTAEMRLGIGFSFNSGDTPSQFSTVRVNGTLITSVAGNFDDGFGANGGLITMGGDDDSVTGGTNPGDPPVNPSSLLTDHERYNLLTLLNNGDTAINIATANPSTNDNIFVAVFDLGLRAGFEEPPPPDPCINDPQSCVPTSDVPEPGSMGLLGAAMAGWAILRRRRKA